MSYFKAIKQDVVADALNSSTTNLDSGNSYTFTGSISSTLGVAGIQISLKTDQDATIYVDQSPDTTPNWDLVNSYNYYTKDGGLGLTVQAISSYYRVRVVLVGTTATTYFRFQTALCPIVEALPQTLDDDGHLTVSVHAQTDEYGNEAEYTSMGEQRVSEVYRLVGSTFTGTTLDTNFWTATNTAGATSTIDAGELTMATGTTANATSKVVSVRVGRYVGGTQMRFRGLMQCSTNTANNTRTWGPYDSATGNGAYFKLVDNTMSVCTKKGGSETAIASTAWNANRTVPDYTDCVTYEIYWTNSKIQFSAGNQLKHTITASDATWSNTVSLPITFENVNTLGQTEDVSLKCRVATISRLGAFRTESIYKHISGAATTICKYGPGTLHRITVNSPGTLCTIVDNFTGSTPVMAIVDTNKTTGGVGDYSFDCPFFTGLTLITTGIGTDITCIYE